MTMKQVQWERALNVPNATGCAASYRPATDTPFSGRWPLTDQRPLVFDAPFSGESAGVLMRPHVMVEGRGGDGGGHFIGYHKCKHMIFPSFLDIANIMKLG